MPDPTGLGLNTDTPSVLFVDLNSAFASIEQQYRPELRGKPVLVAPGAARGSAVISASREARLAGVKTGMRIYEARKLLSCPVILEPDPLKYRAVSRLLLDMLGTYSPEVLPLSIDEAAVNLRGTISMGRDLRELGLEVKRRLREEVGDWLTCSVGFATNIFLAKQAAEIEKPDGLVVIDHRNLVETLSRLKLTDLTGISTGNAARMARAGIGTPLQLLSADNHTLRHQVFNSIVGEIWHRQLRGFETASFKEARRKSLSHSYVLPRPSASIPELDLLALRLCDKLGRRLRRDSVVAGRIAVQLRYESGDTVDKHLRQQRLEATTGITAAARTLLARAFDGRPVRQLGIAVTELAPVEVAQLDLFSAGSSRASRVSAAVDRLRDRFGEGVIFPASLLGHENLAPDRIAFGKLPASLEDSPGAAD